MNNLEYLLHQVEAQSLTTTLDPRLLIDCIDLTSLNADDTEASIKVLCEEALQQKVAAVCVYPAFILEAVAMLKNSAVKVATVANFPTGAQALSLVLNSIEKSLQYGAEEIDVVIPYQRLLETQDATAIKNFVKACKEILPNQTLKVILESGAIADKQQLETLALACLQGGADFLKTSTGKILQGASLHTAAVMLSAIQRFGDDKRGFKASGGIKNYQQAKTYYVLAQTMLGDGWPNHHNFRLGASSLLDDLLQLKLK